MRIAIGIDAARREEITTGLARVLLDPYMLYLKTHDYHWNVARPMFQALHLMVETHCREDEAAPRRES